MKKIFTIFLLFLSLSLPALAQGKFVLQKGIQDKINFKFIHNLIVIPVEINGTELSFLLDTGISKPIIFNFYNLTEKLQINQTERIYLRGLGEGESVEALRSRSNIFKIGNAVNVNQDLYAIFDPDLNFAPQLGIPIHGIIGYDFLKDFVVEINYSKKHLKIFDPDNNNLKKCKKCKSLPLEFHNNKPYILASIETLGVTKQVKLLIDSGGSDSLWLFEDKEIAIPDKYFHDFLGRGLSGSVYGKRAKIDKLLIADFELKKVNVAFPDSTAIFLAKKIKDRNGSLGGEVLKRFKIVFDYPSNKITLRKNGFFKNPFYYNKSGITLEHIGVRVIKELDRSFKTLGFNKGSKTLGSTSIFLYDSYKFSLASAFTIVELRENSPAQKAGLQIGDVILSINNKEAHTYSLQKVTQLFYGEDGKRIKLLIDRKGVQMKFQFKLESLL